MNIQVFWNIMPSWLADSYWCLTGPECLYLLGQAICLALKMKALCPFKMSITIYQLKEGNIQDDWNLHDQCCKNLISYTEGVFCPHPQNISKTVSLYISTVFWNNGTIMNIPTTACPPRWEAYSPKSVGWTGLPPSHPGNDSSP